MNIVVTPAIDLGITLIICVLVLVWSYGNAAYNMAHNWDLIESAAKSVLAMLVLTALSYAVFSRHLVVWMAFAFGALTLFSVGLTIRNVRKAVAALDSVFMTEGGENLAGMSTLVDAGQVQSIRFGPHQFVIDANRILSCRHYMLRDSIGPVKSVVFWSALMLVYWHFVPRFHFAFVLCQLVVSAAGKAMGVRTKLARLSLLLEVRGQMILVDDKRRGSISDATIDVRRGAQDQTVMLVNAGDYGECVLVTTHDRTDQQAERIAEVIREFLKQRLNEEVWPPEPAVQKTNA